MLTDRVKPRQWPDPERLRVVPREGDDGAALAAWAARCLHEGLLQNQRWTSYFHFRLFFFFEKVKILLEFLSLSESR